MLFGDAMNLKGLVDGVSGFRGGTARSAYDNLIRLPSVLWLLAVCFSACSSTQGTVPMDAQVSCEAASCDAAESRVDTNGVQITCGTVSCAASDSYCEVYTGGVGGQSGSGQSTGTYATYNCVRFSASCSSHGCACVQGGCDCSQNGVGGVTVMCRSV